MANRQEGGINPERPRPDDEDAFPEMIEDIRGREESDDEFDVDRDDDMGDMDETDIDEDDEDNY